MRILSALLVSIVALGGVAAHEGGHEPLICASSAYAPPLTTAGFSGLIDAPDYFLEGTETTDLYFTVDLGPNAYAETRGSVAAELKWTIRANDYDLGLNGTLSERAQPVATPVENTSATVAHCSIVTVQAIDFLAPANLEQLQLKLTVSRTN